MNTPMDLAAFESVFKESLGSNWDRAQSIFTAAAGKQRIAEVCETLRHPPKPSVDETLTYLEIRLNLCGDC